MKVLVINCGSSSFKYQLIDMATEAALCSGLVERIGESMGNLVYKAAPGTDHEKKVAKEQPFPNHTVGMQAVMALLVDPQVGVIKSLDEINAVGHRVVQGAEKFQAACVVTDAVKAGIEEVAPLAPLHNPAHLQGIEVAQQLLPHAPSVVVFDTEFHATMPPKAFLYAVPYELYKENSVRRYGFHGTSHRFVAEAAAKFLNKPFDSFNVVTCHLGNGCSLAAVENGKCVDTSMGMTPLAGVMMGTRSGDIDPAILGYLAKHKNMTSAQLDDMLNKKSGLKGICGMNDMRDIHTARENGDEKAQLAFEMFCYSIRKCIGAYFAVLGRVDALVFTAGIGENDDLLREEVCKYLSSFGISILPEVNHKRSGDVRSLSPKGASVPVLVVPTNEELAIARATQEVLSK